jgi:hypothetical protein
MDEAVKSAFVFGDQETASPEVQPLKAEKNKHYAMSLATSL